MYKTYSQFGRINKTVVDCDNVNKNSIQLRYQYKYDNNIYYAHLINNVDDFNKIYLSKNITDNSLTFNEVISSNKPIKLFIDFDCSNKNEIYQINKKYNIDQIKNILCTAFADILYNDKSLFDFTNYINKYSNAMFIMPPKYLYKINKVKHINNIANYDKLKAHIYNKCDIFSSSTDSKLSYHFIFNCDYAFNSIYDLQYFIMNKYKQYMCNIDELLSNCIDYNVYSNKKSLRIVHSRKLTDISRIKMPLKFMNNINSSYIHYYNDDYKYIYIGDNQLYNIDNVIFTSNIKDRKEDAINEMKDLIANKSKKCNIVFNDKYKTTTTINNIYDGDNINIIETYLKSINLNFKQYSNNNSTKHISYIISGTYSCPACSNIHTHNNIVVL